MILLSSTNLLSGVNPTSVSPAATERRAGLIDEEMGSVTLPGLNALGFWRLMAAQQQGANSWPVSEALRHDRHADTLFVAPVCAHSRRASREQMFDAPLASRLTLTPQPEQRKVR